MDYSIGVTPRNSIDQHAVVAALNVKEELEDPDLHVRMDHRTIAAALSMKEELDDPSHRIENPTYHVKEMLGIVDGFRVARTRGTTRWTQRFERRGLNVGDLGSQ
jgi:hypothetical protein